MLRRKKAFTLVELLVVVSIIALLVSIMMPALSNAREQGQRALCLSHMRGMGTAWLIYADENDDKLIPAHTRFIIESGGTPTLPEFDWDPADTARPPETWIGQWDIVGSGDSTDMLAREATVTLGLMYPYIEVLDFYKCPTITDMFVKSSFAIIDPMNGHDWGAYYSHGVETIKKLTEIKSSAERIVFVCEGSQRGGQSWTPIDFSSADPFSGEWPMPWDRWPSFYHNNGTTFSFADGHADYQQWTDPRALEWNIENYSVTRVVWTDSDDMAWIARYGWGQGALVALLN